MVYVLQNLPMWQQIWSLYVYYNSGLLLVQANQLHWIYYLNLLTGIQSPAKVLHFFNAPPGITEDELRDVSKSLIKFTTSFSIHLLIQTVHLNDSWKMPWVAAFAYRPHLLPFFVMTDF